MHKHIIFLYNFTIQSVHNASYTFSKLDIHPSWYIDGIHVNIWSRKLIIKDSLNYKINKSQLKYFIYLWSSLRPEASALVKIKIITRLQTSNLNLPKQKIK